MTHRMAIAALSVIGFFISLYLWLWKVGFLGSLACGEIGPGRLVEPERILVRVEELLPR